MFPQLAILFWCRSRAAAGGEETLLPLLFPYLCQQKIHDFPSFPLNMELILCQANKAGGSFRGENCADTFMGFKDVWWRSRNPTEWGKEKQIYRFKTLQASTLNPRLRRTPEVRSGFNFCFLYVLLKGKCQLYFFLCYFSPSEVPDKKSETILSTVHAVTMKRRTEHAHQARDVFQLAFDSRSSYTGKNYFTLLIWT